MPLGRYAHAVFDAAASSGISCCPSCNDCYPPPASRHYTIQRVKGNHKLEAEAGESRLPLSVRIPNQLCGNCYDRIVSHLRCLAIQLRMSRVYVFGHIGTRHQAASARHRWDRRCLTLPGLTNTWPDLMRCICVCTSL